MSASSPEGVPDTLWRYKALQLQEMPQIPMMGVHFSQQFLTAFILGLAFLCYFAGIVLTRANPEQRTFAIE